VGESESPSAPLGVKVHFAVPEGLHTDADLDVPQLAKEVMAAIADALGPSEEHVAGRLHEPVPVHDPLAMVGEHARAGIRLQHAIYRNYGDL
jgi:hypothetical protein